MSCRRFLFTAVMGAYSTSGCGGGACDGGGCGASPAGVFGRHGVPVGDAVLDGCHGRCCAWGLGVGAELTGAVDGENGVGVEGPEGEAAVLIALLPAALVSDMSWRSEV